ncbi:14498_t:CDS:1 [Dentiscutata heterogama]|uniref:14498_t:CDS:1 n=1 Tax=Dentiscutata heterogama TaxID=1316150 RepID=A0ACA9K9X3_9GLOM|nr:14498_t:CDS:1 [Dentiscutata heterogama]
MSEVTRLSYHVLNSGVLRQNYDANDLARSYRCVDELTGFKVLQLVVMPECHRNNIRCSRTIKQITTCIWNDHTTRSDKEYFIDLASQINEILANQRPYRTIRKRPRRMPDMEHNSLSLTIFYGSNF